MWRPVYDVLGPLLAAYAVVFVVNLVPAFMPPTWSILAYFLIRFELPLFPLAIGGALAASSGRWVLALASNRWGRNILSPGRREKLSILGDWLSTRARWLPPLAVLIYSFGPIPSNQLFMAAGLTGMRLRPIVVAFLAGRLVSYTVWISVAHVVSARFEDLFTGYLQRAGPLALELLALATLVAFTRIDWPRVLRLDARGRSEPTSSNAVPG